MNNIRFNIEKNDNIISYLPFGGQNSKLIIGVNNRYIEKNSKPWIPVMGEIHFSRYPEALWENEILKMKAGGIQIIATYLFWIYHEEIEGQFEWSGNKNLRKFIEFCQKHDLFVFIRPGPWAHGECRNGGFPDWLIQKGCKLRTNDDEYLYYVKKWFNEIHKQVKGLYFKDDGPIIGIQFENELYNNAEHIKKLKEIALEIGMSAPIYTVTGWGPGGAKFPPNEVIPSFGGYPEAPWEQHTNELPPNPNFFFSKIRVDSAIGNDLIKKDKSNNDNNHTVDHSHYPYITCEIGGGIQKTYHRRPIVNSDDVASIAMIKLASGCNLLGYYMYHGGSHQIGRLSTLQESKETGYPNDYPVISYDFQAPLGQFGQIRGHFHKLRNLHMFIEDFGEVLAPMDVYFPDKLPSGLYDANTPRVCIRSDGECGFAFFSNYQRNPKLKDIPKIQVNIKLNDGEDVVIPSTPFDLARDMYFFFPFNLDIQGLKLKKATVQPLCKVKTTKGNEYAYFFKAIDGIEIEYVFDGTLSEYEINEEAIRFIDKKDNTFVFKDVYKGIEYPISLKHKKLNKTILIYTLSEKEAERCWKVNFSDNQHVIISDANLYYEKNRIIILSQREENNLLIFPKLKNNIYFNGKKLEQTQIGQFVKVMANIQMTKYNVEIREVPFEKQLYDKYLFMNEEEEKFAKQYELHWSIENPDNLNDAILEIDYVGDVIQAYHQDRLINDDYYDGVNKFEVNIKDIDPNYLTCKVSPLTEDKKIYLQKWPIFNEKYLCKILNASIKFTYKAIFELK